MNKLKRFKGSRNQLYCVFISLGFIFLLLTVSVVVQSVLLPKSLIISPGQSFTLSVNFPLSFNAGTKKLLSVSHLQSLFKQNLILSPVGNQQYNIQLILFGKIPIKQLHIKVANPPLVIPCGHAIGVLVSSKGVVVVGHLPVTGSDRQQYYPAKNAGLKVGDVLLTIEDLPIHNVSEVEDILSSYTGEPSSLRLTVKREDRLLECRIEPVLTEDGLKKRYMLGLFIEDPAAGVGTLSFYSPKQRAFAGLGHQISGLGGKNGVAFQYGEIILANISGIREGSPGKPGEKIGLFSAVQQPIGKITKNSKFGIYGMMYPNFVGLIKNDFFKPIPIAYSSQIREGPAFIYTVVKGSQIESFEVEIVKVYRQNLPRDKGMVVKVTDARLLEETGGIIQGMSGSPIIQDGRLIGAVTHVFVNDPTKGYGVHAEWMMKELTDSYQQEKAS